MHDTLTSINWTEFASFLVVLAAFRAIINRIVKTINLNEEVISLQKELADVKINQNNQKIKLEKIDFMLKMLLGSKHEDDNED